MLIAGFLPCCLFLGATRATAADPFREGAALVAMATGALVYRTSQAGTIELRGDAGGWSLG